MPPPPDIFEANNTAILVLSQDVSKSRAKAQSPHQHYTGALEVGEC